ncbi:MAG TPA: efflux RND transporter permease subunit [Saprospiraceae bacterium]|nr:efflux RND transporter permease subunit [Saprospiraceae bacterium]HMQ84622.1 efflux RND transporter permease subunit [Saprospiraceae bacterium]
MNITKLALQYNRVTLLALLVIIALGLMQYKNLSRDSMPPFVVRTATIITQFPGASPERVESLISDKIEKVLQEIPEVKTIQSTSRTGVSIIKISVDDNISASELQVVWDLARRKIENIRNDLPDGIFGPNLDDEDVGVVYGIVVGLEADGFEYSELKDYADDLRNELIALDDAAKVVIGGAVEERIYVAYNDAKLAQLGLTATQVQNIISYSNIIIPSGQVNLGEERIILESSGNFESVEAIQNLVIPLNRQGETIRLGEIANVGRGYVQPYESIVRVNGNPALSLSISLKEGANLIDLGKDVDQLIQDYNENNLPLGIEAVRIASQDLEVQKKLDVFVGNLFQSIVIVLLVILLILGWRAGVIIASLIPGTIILTFLLMGIFGVGLNQVTLASLIMALGLLVDNGIVMVEALIEKLQKGQSRFQAAVNSASEFFIPLLISSLTTCAAFLAFYLADGALGEMMGNIFLVITMALLSSLLFAFTIVPLFANYFLKVKQGEHEHQTIFDRFRGKYNDFLNWALNRPVITLITIVLLFVVALVGFGYVPSIFMPPSDRNLVVVDINFPLGTKIETTDGQVALMDRYIRDSLEVDNASQEGIVNWSSYIGRGPEAYDLGYFPGEPNSSYAHMLLNTTSNEANDIVIERLQKFVGQNIFDAEVKISRLVGSGGAEAPIEIRVSGENPDELFKIAESIKTRLYQTAGVMNISDDWGPRSKKLYIDIDDDKLAKAGLTNQDVALSLLTSLNGFEVGEYRDEDNTIPITMKQESSEEIDYNDIQNLNVYSQMSGTSSPLSQVAEIRIPWQYSKILRRNLKRNLTIQASVQEGYLASDIMENDIRPMIEEEASTWEKGYDYEFGGDAEGSNDAIGAVMLNLPLSFFIIILLLTIQFNSMRKTGIIFMTIPLAVIGVTAGLLLAGSFFSFTAFLGIISLAGIIINDAIVLVDKIGTELNEGNGLLESIKSAANHRFSPILLTTLTTSCGMVPLWTGGGELWSPMAITMIFGLLFATLILLIFVPVVYSLLFKIKKTTNNAD